MTKITFKDITIKFESRPQGNSISFPLGSNERIEELKNFSYNLKEGCKYKIEFTFQVEGDPICLKCITSDYEGNVKFNNDIQNLGAYTTSTHTIELPHRGWDEAPGKTFFGNNYTRKVVFSEEFDEVSPITFIWKYSVNSDW